MYYLQSRYYNPEWGRFINADDVGNTQVGMLLSHNLYTYCFNNPINMEDPSGDIGQFIFAGVGAGYAGALEVGGANLWNPLGWAVLGVCAVTAVGLGIYYLASSSSSPSKSTPTPRNFKNWKKNSGPQYEFLTKMFIATKALQQVYDKWYQKGVDAFLNAAERGFVGPYGQTGIKKLTGSLIRNGIKYTAEIKLFNEYGDYRIYGYLNKAGQWIFDWFGKAQH